jgi:uncharacterized membrane protein
LPKYKHLIANLKKEAVYVLLTIPILFTILEVAYFKEAIWGNILLAVSLFWMFILPGYCILSYWEKDLELIERIIIGTVLGIAVFGMISYALGFIPIHVKYHAYIIPPIVIIGGLMFKLSRKDDTK